MKHFSSAFYVGILTFIFGVSIVMFWYFRPSLLSSSEEPILPETQLIIDKPFLSETPITINESKSNVLFDGENIDVIEDVQSNFEQIPFDTKNIPKDRRCFQKLEKKIINKLNVLGLRGKTKYFKFDERENESFTLKLSKEQSGKINLNFIKKLDSNADFTLSDELYFIKNNNHGYLLLTGHETAASGIGHLYRHHILVPMDSNKSIVEFDSMLSDPRKIKIDDSGTIYYTQIDSTYFGAARDVNSDYFDVIVSFFTFDGVSNKKNEFNYRCASKEMY
jgi:hypothetical protein